MSTTLLSLITSLNHPSSGMLPHLMARSIRYGTGLCGSLCLKNWAMPASMVKASSRVSGVVRIDAAGASWTRLVIEAPGA
ncbi:hypothetical protein D3C87_1875680 [compost metagenome]